jgi:hypothetical protein
MLGRFGNGGIIEFSPAAYASAGLLAVVALAGLVGVARREAGSRPGSSAGGLWLVHALTVAVVAASVLAFALRFNGGATGKYLFPAFPSLAVLLAGGWLSCLERWPHPRRAWAAAAILALSLAAAVYAIFGLLRPAYGPPRRPWPGEVGRARPLEADLGGAARVLAYKLDRERAQPGDSLRITVYWLPQDYTPAPYTVFVHVYVPGVGLIAQTDIYPGGGTYPTDVWVPGRPFVDTYTLRLPSDAPGSTAAEIVLGLYDEQTGLRLTATGADAGPAGTDWIELGTVAFGP